MLKITKICKIKLRNYKIIQFAHTKYRFKTLITNISYQFNKILANILLYSDNIRIFGS